MVCFLTLESYDFPEFAGFGLKFGSLTALDSDGNIQAVGVSNDAGGPLDLEVGSHFPIYDFCGLVSLFRIFITGFPVADFETRAKPQGSETEPIGIV